MSSHPSALIAEGATESGTPESCLLAGTPEDYVQVASTGAKQ